MRHSFGLVVFATLWSVIIVAINTFCANQTGHYVEGMAVYFGMFCMFALELQWLNQQTNQQTFATILQVPGHCAPVEAANVTHYDPEHNRLYLDLQQSSLLAKHHLLNNVAGKFQKWRLSRLPHTVFNWIISFSLIIHVFLLPGTFLRL